jgi:hypothetical protein
MVVSGEEKAAASCQVRTKKVTGLTLEGKK